MAPWGGCRPLAAGDVQWRFLAMRNISLAMSLRTEAGYCCVCSRDRHDRIHHSSMVCSPSRIVFTFLSGAQGHGHCRAVWCAIVPLRAVHRPLERRWIEYDFGELGLSTLPLLFPPLDFLFDDLSNECGTALRSHQLVDPLAQALGQANGRKFHSERWATHDGFVSARANQSTTSQISVICY